MASQEEPQGPSAPFPTPPPFYKNFSRENLSRLRHLRRAAGLPPDTTTTPNDLSLLLLPPELRTLVPPPPPAPSAHYPSFGTSMTLSPPTATLAEGAIEQLYPPHPSVPLNPQPHLTALARSLLTTFLALTGILASNSEAAEAPSQDLQTIAFNMHDLINRYRPHQARETLILMMEERVEQVRREMREIERGRERVGEVLGELRRQGVEVEGAVERGWQEREGEDEEGRKRKVRQRAAWAALEKEMGRR